MFEATISACPYVFSTKPLTYIFISHTRLETLFSKSLKAIRQIDQRSTLKVEQLINNAQKITIT